MAQIIPLVTFTVLTLCLTARGQQLAVVTPPNSSVIQCANLSVEWNGGISPFFLVLGTPDSSNVTDVEIVQSVAKSPYVWNVDVPAGTGITLAVRDADGTNVETPILAVQNSSNSSCLPGNPNTTPPAASVETTNSDPTSSQASSGTSASTSPGTSSSRSPSPIATGTPSSKSSSSASRIPIIAGVVAGCLVFLALIILLMTMQKRRSRRQHMTSKDAFVRTFGSAKADLDGSTEEHTEAMAMPDPYVYGSVSQGRPTPAPSTLAPIDTEDLSRGPSTPRSDPAGPSTRSPSTPATAKGERYLPNYTNPAQERTPGGVSSPRPGIQEEDIDRLAARMVEMMSVGRLADQAWTPGPQRRRDEDMDEIEDVRVPPPMYKDVARRSGSRPTGGGGGRF